LYYYRNRYYHPELQRFITEDPIGFYGKDLNLYSYVWNSPIEYRDPLGLAGEQPFGGGGGQFGGGGSSECWATNSCRREPDKSQPPPPVPPAPPHPKDPVPAEPPPPSPSPCKDHPYRPGQLGTYMGKLCDGDQEVPKPQRHTLPPGMWDSMKPNPWRSGD